MKREKIFPITNSNDLNGFHPFQSRGATSRFHGEIKVKIKSLMEKKYKMDHL